MTAAPRRRWSPFDRFWQWREKRLIELCGTNGDTLPDGSSPRRFRFGLRTMFVVVTLLCIVGRWTVCQLDWVRERNAFVEEITFSTFDVNFSPAPIGKWVVVPQPPLSLRIFGERYAPFASLYFWDETPRELVSNAKRLFPEANVECAGPRPIMSGYPEGFEVTLPASP